MRDLATTVVLASNVPRFWADMCETLDGLPDIQIGTCTGEVGELLHIAKNEPPDLALLDLKFPWNTICLLTSRFYELSVPTLIVGEDISNSVALDLLRRGTSGVISREESPEVMLKSVRSVVRGSLWVSRQLQEDILVLIRGSERHAAHVPDHVASERPHKPEALRPNELSCDDACSGLTRREIEVALAVSDGRTNEEVANSLRISASTVKHHLSSIFRKTGVRNRTELVRFSWEAGIDRVGDEVAATVQ